MGSRLKKKRIEAGLTQTQLAAKAGINKRTLQYYEQKVRPIDGANIMVILKLCKILACEVSDIVESHDVRDVYEDYIDSILE